MAADLDARARRLEREEREQWMKERAQMLEENQRLRDQLARITKRFKLTQTALVEQQKVLDRYQRELVRCGSKVIQGDADASDTLDKKRDAENVCNEQVEGTAAKRVRATSVKHRHSLPLAERHTNESGADRVHTSPTRRRSLPEPQRQSDQGGLASHGRGEEAWVTRKLDIDGDRPTINASELLRPRQLVRPRPSVLKQDAVSRPREEHARGVDSDDAFLDAHDDAEGDDKKTVVKAEPQQSKPTALLQRPNRGQPERTAPRKRELPFRSNPPKLKTERPPPAPRSTAANPTYAYVEVVRNREERAALPGHDCAECRKYYEALDGLVPEDEIKAKCSRHRARFTPYQTPDDFWRLSFPDSESQDMMSP